MVCVACLFQVFVSFVCYRILCCVYELRNSVMQDCSHKRKPQTCAVVTLHTLQEISNCGLKSLHQYAIFIFKSSFGQKCSGFKMFVIESIKQL